MKRVVMPVLLALLGLFLGGQSGSWALEIVYPSDGTYFPRSNFLIIKGGEGPPLEGMTVEVNGAKSDVIDVSSDEYRAAFADLLILQPEFDPGENSITVEGYIGGRVAETAEATVFYLNGDPSAIPPRDFVPFVMHLPEKEVHCAPCHNMNPDAVELQSGQEGMNPCASCHRRMIDKEFVHGPAGVYQCIACHDPESSPARYRLVGNGSDLCNGCHMEKVALFKTNKFVHGPVGVGLCTVCHDAHASNQPAQLLAAPNAVCLGCHVTIKDDIHVVRGVSGKGHPLEGVPDPANPGHSLSCASCHDPHAGKTSYLFRFGLTSRFALCQRCHKK